MISHPTMSDELTVDRRRANRRISNKSRGAEAASAASAAPQVKSDRRKIERRRQIDPTTCERDYTEEQVEFMKAMDLYKRRSGRQFPTWSEVLEVIENLGYRKVAEPTEIYQQPHE